MICPTCHPACNGIEHDQCTPSTVRMLRTTPGTLPKDHFWDTDGAEHNHNPNIIVTEFECSNGHRFAERSSWQCHVCGYKACDAEIVAAPATLVGHTLTGTEVHGVRRSSSGRVITAEERERLNSQKGGR